MKLITDTLDYGNVRLVTESTNTGIPQAYYIEGIYAQSEKRNGNGRIYRYKDLKREIDRFRTEMIDTGRALQECEHPDTPIINIDRACARILSLTEDNGSWIGKSVILASFPERGIKGTVKGDLIASCLQYGTNIGNSTRAIGDVGEDGVVTDLKLITIDVVTNPSIGIMTSSNANRFVNGILESRDFVLGNHGEIVERLENCYKCFSKNIGKSTKTNISSKKAKILGDALTEFFNSIVS